MKTPQNILEEMIEYLYINKECWLCQMLTTKICIEHQEVEMFLQEDLSRINKETGWISEKNSCNK